MEEVVLTKEEAAKLLKVSEISVARMEKEGVIRRCKHIPGIKYRKADIYKLLEIKQDPMSPFERRRLEERIVELEERLSLYRTLTGTVAVQLSEIMRREGELQHDGGARG